MSNNNSESNEPVAQPIYTTIENVEPVETYYEVPEPEYATIENVSILVYTTIPDPSEIGRAVV